MTESEKRRFDAYDRMMRTVPNMKPRGHGIMIHILPETELCVRIHNQYIVFLKEQRKLRESEVACDQESFIDLFDDKLSDNNEFDDILLQDAMMDVLSEKERICIEMIVLRGFTAQHVADKLGVTKQAVNQCKNRALAKLKDLLQ